MNNNNNPFSLPKLNDEKDQKVETLEEQPNNQPKFLNQTMNNPQVSNNQAPANNMMPQNMNNGAEENKPIIEIPQEYYDKLAEEEAEKAQKAAEEEKLKQQKQEFNNASGEIFTLALFNAVVFGASLFIMIKKFEIAIFVIPVVIVVATIMHAMKKGKESNYPTSVLMGGMIIAVITFVLSVIRENQSDFWFHLAVCGAIIAFVGLMVSSVITKLIARREEVPALESVGYIIFFIALIGVPFYFYKKSPEEFHRLVFQNITEVKAETEEEFVVKTLKNRYNIDFTCETNIKNHIDYGNKLTRSRTCTDANKNQINVTSYDYNTLKNQYIVIDDYMQVLYLKNFSTKLASGISTQDASITEVSVYFLPEKGCTFIGDCAESEEYRSNLKEEEDLNNQYKISSTLDLSKYMFNTDAISFINDYKFKVIIRITGNFANIGSSEQYINLVDKILAYLNTQGLENSYGFDILIQRNLGSELVKEELMVTGVTNTERTFKDYKVIKDAND